ncbi:Protein SPA2 [Astathelohania contejeani]|uniref:Protein SPA2 n=1 Tax=Astathelohania contejeani TaxID=164912 RepID=A0ABQ7I126_9MICR|nr:Protein SPA2 [Thelohania contejeani]
MSTPVNDEIIRCTLKSYIGRAIEEIQIESRQKEAIQKMIFLDKTRFFELVDDVMDEISRRETSARPFLEPQKIYSNNRNLSRKRLARLSNDHFHNLVLDVYLVYIHHIPGSDKMPSGVNTLISDLERLIQNLKDQKNRHEIVLEAIREESSYLKKMKIFYEYLREIFTKHNEELIVINHIESLPINHSNINILLEPTTFLEQCDSYFKNDFVDEYNFHKRNINDNKNNRYILNREILGIVGLLLKIESDKPDISIVQEVQIIIDVLTHLKDRIVVYGMDFDYKPIVSTISEVTNSIINKVKIIKQVSDYNIENLIKEKNMLDEIDPATNNENIPGIIYRIANIVKKILAEIPGDN